MNNIDINDLNNILNNEFNRQKALVKLKEYRKNV